MCVCVCVCGGGGTEFTMTLRGHCHLHCRITVFEARNIYWASSCYPIFRHRCTLYGTYYPENKVLPYFGAPVLKKYMRKDTLDICVFWGV